MGKRMWMPGNVTGLVSGRILRGRSMGVLYLRRHGREYLLLRSNATTSDQTLVYMQTPFLR